MKLKAMTNYTFKYVREKIKVMYTYVHIIFSLKIFNVHKQIVQTITQNQFTDFEIFVCYNKR